VDYVALLAEIGAEQNFTVVYVEIEELSKANRSKDNFKVLKSYIYLEIRKHCLSSEILQGGNPDQVYFTSVQDPIRDVAIT
jgi:hypothetical protein